MVFVLSVLLGMLLLGTQIFAPFELETPVWRKIVKWSAVIALTVLLYRFIGPWAVLAPCGLGLLGISFHYLWCKKNDIDPLRATPRRRYYELRGWEWLE